MSFSSKIRSIALAIRWKNLHKQPTCRIKPEPVTPTNMELSNNLESEPIASTSSSSSVFVIENRVNASKFEKASFIADATFGDIGGFLHHVRSDHDNVPPAVVHVEDATMVTFSNEEENASNESLQQACLFIPSSVAPIEDATILTISNEEEAVGNESLQQDSLNVPPSVENIENATIVTISNEEENAADLPLQQECIEIQEETEVEPEPENTESSEDYNTLKKLFASQGIPNPNDSATCKPSCYIQMHFDLMYILGISTYTTTEQPTSNLWTIWTSYMQMIFFSLIVTLSTLQSFFDAKYCFIWFLYGGGLNQLIRVAFNLTCLVSSAYGAYILRYKQKELRKMFYEMTLYDQTYAAKTKYSYFTTALALTTLFLAFMKALFVVPFEDFSVKEVLLDGSYTISEDMFLWHPSNLNNSIEKLSTDFGTNLSLISISMGSFKFVRDFAFNLQQGMVWDIFANIILVMFSWIMVFMVYVNATKENFPENDSAEGKKLQKMRVGVWKMYRDIRDIFAPVNEVFGTLLMLFHIIDVLRYAFLMELCIFPEGSTAFTFIHLLYDILKSEVIYLIATNMSQQNKIIRKWLRNWAIETGKIDIGKKKLDITVVLDELDEEKLGLGQGDFVIDQSFHFGLLGLVSSLFVMLANKTGVKV